MPDESDLLYALDGILLFILVSDFIPSLKKLGGVKSAGCSKCSGLSLDKILGIDVNALNVCRQKGLM